MESSDVSVKQNVKQHHLTFGHVNNFNKQKLKYTESI